MGTPQRSHTRKKPRCDAGSCPQLDLLRMSFDTVSGIALRSPQGEFVNEPFVNFAAPENARGMRAALSHVATQLGREYDLIIGGHREKTAGKITSLNPARPAQIVGLHQKAGAEHAQEAMDAALRAFHSWSRTPAEVRSSLLLNAAAIIRERKLEFAAWLGVGSIQGANAIVSEAARFWAATAPRSSPRAMRADISLSSTEPVAMTMTPPGN